MDMSFYVHCITLCLLVGQYPVSSCRGSPTVIHPSLNEISGNRGNPLKHRLTSGVKIAAGAIVHKTSILRGDITIGAGTVVNPLARILAVDGPIVIGGGNIIEAKASIINRVPRGGSSGAGKTQRIGNGNIFQTGSTCYALRVGGGNIFQPGAKVGREVVVTDGNIIGPSYS